MPDARSGRGPWRVHGIPAVTVGAAALALTASILTIPTAAAEVSTQISAQSACSNARAALRGMEVDTSEIFSQGRVTLDGWTVAFRPSRWRAQHDRIDLFTRSFHSSAWMIPDSREDLEPAIGLFLEQARNNPDPGAGVGPEALKARGWIESHVTWRMKTGLCLYGKADEQGRERLLPALEQLIEANLDPYRYYGPPIRPAHNHGLMADRELLNAARILKRDDLADLAVHRLSLQQEQMYDPCGFMFEQASSYQHLHASLWNQIRRRIPVRSEALGLQEMIELINTAAFALTFPDGMVPIIGDGTSRIVDDVSVVAGNLSWLCTKSGWFTRRIVSKQLSQQVIARFGPSTTMHGHTDKGSLVWWVGRGQQGQAVIVDRGLPSKTDPDGVRVARSVASHAAFDWNDSADRETKATQTRLRGGRERLVISGSTSVKGRWFRTVTYSKERAVLTIKDRVRSSGPAGAARSFVPLDPAWKPMSKPGVFSTTEGARMTVTCSTSSGERIRVKTQRVADYQQTIARKAFTVMCQVSDAREGITVKLRIDRQV